MDTMYQQQYYPALDSLLAPSRIPPPAASSRSTTARGTGSTMIGRSSPASASGRPARRSIRGT